MSYSNFKDPLGLLKRMLLSRNKVAYSVLLREFSTKLMVPADYLLKSHERKLLRTEKGKSELPIILVLGGSRNGTTLMYQTLVRYLPVSYFSNFIAAFEKSPIAASKMFKRIIPGPKKNFDSYFGSVEGMGGANDGFTFWNRWLGEDRNYIPDKISAGSKLDMKRFFETWLDTTQKPFVNKNNRNSLCAPMFAEIFDNVYFVEIHRNPIFVAQSLVLSRRTVQGTDKIGWGLLSTDSEKHGDRLSYIDDICNQVNRVEKVLAKNRKKMDPKRYFRIAYEDFCENPCSFVQTLGLEALGHRIKTEELADLRFPKTSNAQRLNDEEFDRIRTFFYKISMDDQK